MTDDKMMDLLKELFPICRSITGNGTRATLQILKRYCPMLEVYEVASGTKVFDWEVPDEWNIEEGYIEDEQGNRIIDFKENNLHIMSYSAPIDRWLDLEELKKYLYTLPEQPTWIPYVTSYYNRKIGFCMSQNMADSLSVTEQYHAVIKSDFNAEGSLSYGEILLKGESEKEIFLSTYICHPSMANNECSGPTVLVYLVNYILSIRKRRYTYRIVFLPETIGAIAYLSKNYVTMKHHIIAGYVLSCVGDNNNYSMVHSRYGNNLAEKALKNVMQYKVDHYREYSFLERGSDERQYCSPGIDLPVCTFCRTKFHDYPEYHTSADDLSIISEEGLRGSLEVMKECIDNLERNEYYKLDCLCEPQLGKRGLYPEIGTKGKSHDVKKIQDFIMYADGLNDLIDISNLIGCPVRDLIKIVDQLQDAQLLTVKREK